MGSLRRSPQAYRRSLCRNPNIELYWFDGDEALLHVINSGLIYPLDSLGLYIWFSLEEGIGVAQLVRDLVQRGSSEPEASLFVNQLVLLHDGKVLDEPDEIDQELPAWDEVPPYCECKEDAHYRVLDVGINISGISGKLLAELSSILAPCLVTQLLPANLQLRVQASGHSYCVIANDFCVADGVKGSNLLPLLLDGVRRYAYLHSRFMIAFHAAAIGRDNYRLLMPAASGSGKSTLSAGLMARGWCVYTDEVAVLNGRDFSLRPLPVGVGIKSASWSLVEGRVHSLRECPIHERRNGIRIRYLPVPAESAATQVLPATHLVFPNYQQGEATTLTPLSVVESLRHFQRSDYHIVSPLGREGMACFLDWLISIPRYAFTFGDLDAALDALESLG